MNFVHPNDDEAFIIYEVTPNGDINPLRFTWKSSRGAEGGGWIGERRENNRWVWLYWNSPRARNIDYLQQLIRFKGDVDDPLYRRHLRTAQNIAHKRLESSIARYKKELCDCMEERRRLTKKIRHYEKQRRQLGKMKATKI